MSCEGYICFNSPSLYVADYLISCLVKWNLKLSAIFKFSSRFNNRYYIYVVVQIKITRFINDQKINRFWWHQPFMNPNKFIFRELLNNQCFQKFRLDSKCTFKTILKASPWSISFFDGLLSWLPSSGLNQEWHFW